MVGLVSEQHEQCGLPLLPPTLSATGMRARFRDAVGAVTLAAAVTCSAAGTVTLANVAEQLQAKARAKAARGRQMLAKWRGGGIERYWSAWRSLAAACKQWRRTERELALPLLRAELGTTQL